MSRQSHSGQSTLEYLLTLFTVISLFLVVARQVIRPLNQKLAEYVNRTVDGVFANGDLHNFTLGGRN